MPPTALGCVKATRLHVALNLLVVTPEGGAPSDACRHDTPRPRALRPDVADLGHPVPVHPGRGRRGLASDAGLRPLRDRGRDSASHRAAARRPPARVAALALGGRLCRGRDRPALGPSGFRGAARDELARRPPGGGSAARRDGRRRGHGRSRPRQPHHAARAARRVDRGCRDRRCLRRRVQHHRTARDGAGRHRLCGRAGHPVAPARRPAVGGRDGAVTLAVCAGLRPDRRNAATGGHAEPKRAGGHRDPCRGVHGDRVPALRGAHRRDRSRARHGDHLRQPGSRGGRRRGGAKGPVHDRDGCRVPARDPGFGTCRPVAVREHAGWTSRRRGWPATCRRGGRGSRVAHEEPRPGPTR